MPTLFARLAEWWAFTMTYDALRRLDPIIRAELGLSDADLRRIARRAINARGQISIYQLTREVFGDEGERDDRAARAPIGCAPARHGAR